MWWESEEKNWAKLGADYKILLLLISKLHLATATQILLIKVLSYTYSDVFPGGLLNISS